MATLYEKRGRRYVPVHDTLALDGLSNGSWLVTVNDGYSRIRRPVDDEIGLKVLAACSRWLEELITDEIYKKSAAQHGRGVPLSKKEQKAAKAYREVMGDDKYLIWFTRPSARDIAHEVVREIVARVGTDEVSLDQQIDALLAIAIPSLREVVSVLKRLAANVKVDPSEIRSAINALTGVREECTTTESKPPTLTEPRYSSRQKTKPKKTKSHPN